MMKLFSILALFAIVLYGATLAQAEDVGYNTSDTDTVVIGSDPNTGGPTQADVDAINNIQQGTADLKAQVEAEAAARAANGQ